MASDIVEWAREHGIAEHSMAALLDVLRRLPGAPKDQWKALNDYREKLEPAAKRVLKQNDELMLTLEGYFMEALTALIEQQTEGSASAEDALQREMNEWFGNLQNPLQRLYTALSGPLWLHLKTEGLAAEILETVAHGAAIASVDIGPGEEYNRPEDDTSLTDAFSEWHDEGPPVRVLNHTSLATITWGELHEAALKNGADWVSDRIHANDEKAKAFMRREDMAELVEAMMLQQPICFRDDRALTGDTETSEAEADQLPAPTEGEATNRPPIPEDADPFGGRKAKREGHCIALKDAWDELAGTEPTKDDLHREAGPGARKGIERALKDVGWWPIDGPVVEYVTAVEKLLNWHKDRT
ncbi:MAG: hypothetical protein PPP56_07230 [Longimonas sp.]|uniref:hypothetical protein n=1 Tax=Longimonas sp. TaxID=2039626 RepID=UPI003362C0A3